MNSILLKALADQQQKEANRQEYAKKFNALERDYRTAMEKAYGLDSADEFRQEGSLGRTADVLTSRILGMFPGRVAEGRAGMVNMNPILVNLLRGAGVKDAFQGAREAEMQIPNENNPVAMLNFFDKVRSMGNIPYLANDPRIKQRTTPKTSEETQKDIDEYESLLRKYGYK